MTAVLIPWRPGCSHREAALEWVTARWKAEHADWPVILGASPDGPFSRSAAILDAFRQTDADVLVVADGDVWCDVTEALEHLEGGWAVPHTNIHRLSQASTEKFMAGADWRGLPLSTDNPQDRRPYRGNETGTLVLLTRETFEVAPPDPRFAGWGQEDTAWSIALRRLVGAPWRGTADLVHLWHPAQPRQSRVIGNQANVALLNRYRNARTPDAMRTLIGETCPASR